MKKSILTVALMSLFIPTVFAQQAGNYVTASDVADILLKLDSIKQDVEDLRAENEILKQEIKTLKGNTYVDRSMADLRNLVEGLYSNSNRVKLITQQRLTPSQKGYFHQVISDCFDLVKQDAPNIRLRFDEIWVNPGNSHGNNLDVGFSKINSRLILYTNSTVQTCYDRILTDASY